MILRKEHININISNSKELKQVLSLEYLIIFLQEKVGKLDSYEQAFPKLILERIFSLEKDFGGLNEDTIPVYEEIFSYLYYYSSNAIHQDEILWAIGFPVPDRVFYGQKQFFGLLDSNMELLEESLNTPFYQNFDFSNKLLYLLILERLYHLPSLTLNQLYKVVNDEVNFYYHLKIDYSFMDVESISDHLPTIDLSCLHDKEINSFEDILPLLAPLDLSTFRFKGFTILKLINKSNEQVGVKIQNIISRLPSMDVLSEISSFNRKLVWDELGDVIKTLANSSKVNYSFFPLLELNGVPVLTSDLSKESIFFGELMKRESLNCNHEIYTYLQSPFTITYGIEESFTTTDDQFIHQLKKLNIHSYVCFPLRNKNNLVGFLEVYAHGKDILGKKQLLNIASYLRLITNLAIDLVSTFKSTMDRVILDKFTALQEAVQWRFNQEAANYLSEVSLKKSDIAINKITFEKVYPIYGAIDVRNSTKLRNMAYKKDSYQRLGVIQLMVDQLESLGVSESSQHFVNRFNLVKHWLDEGELDNYLMDILSFFQDEVIPFLELLDKEDLILAKYKKEYLRDYQGPYGAQYGESGQFEQALTSLNSIIALELDEFNAFVQQLFPSYFEKFRTDGIEYDMYLGQSITPTKTFDPGILQIVRKHQIRSMISIAKKTFDAMDDLPIPLVTTQLIFVHPNTIDISFRQDERRFDVEGGYNIRYEVIKKRIDKARIKDSKERLVQPNKIAIVYSSLRVENEIRTILESIVTEGLIKAEIEHVILEELQGIEQLNAFRITLAF